MWTEIWNFITDNIGWFVVGAAGIALLIKKYWYDRRIKKKKTFENDVPTPSVKETALSEQPDYNPFFKPEEDESVPTRSELSTIQAKIEHIKQQGKTLAIESKRIDDWNNSQGIRYVELCDNISLKKKKIDDMYSIWTNHKKDMEKHLEGLDKLNEAKE